MKEYRKRYKAKWRAESGSGSGRHIWTSAEILRIIKHDIPDRDLAKELGVSITAIQIQRCIFRKALKRWIGDEHDEF